MSIEFIGFISNNNSSESIVREGPVLNPTHIETVAKAHENAGFDRALLAFHSTTPDSLQVAQHVLSTTSRLNVLIAQRPGFTAPTLLARQSAVLDQFSRGRVALHVITGGNATELRQDGQHARRQGRALCPHLGVSRCPQAGVVQRQVVQLQGQVLSG
ncbi:alkanesulfonate monooxygenase SsuD/methylene tetrahydromethanopterin reductase-like flavin-dependent oxidoreductase (luciferase family) [Bradyrhizobium sp. USDA 327]